MPIQPIQPVQKVAIVTGALAHHRQRNRRPRRAPGPTCRADRLRHETAGTGDGSACGRAAVLMLRGGSARERYADHTVTGPSRSMHRSVDAPQYCVFFLTRLDDETDTDRA